MRRIIPKTHGLLVFHGSTLIFARFKTFQINRQNCLFKTPLMTYRFISAPTLHFPHDIATCMATMHCPLPLPCPFHFKSSHGPTLPPLFLSPAPSWSARLTVDPSRSTTLAGGTPLNRRLPLGHPRGRHASRPTPPAQPPSRSARLSTRFALLFLITIPFVGLKLHSKMGDY